MTSRLGGRQGPSGRGWQKGYFASDVKVAIKERSLRYSKRDIK